MIEKIPLIRTVIFIINFKTRTKGILLYDRKLQFYNLQLGNLATWQFGRKDFVNLWERFLNCGKGFKIPGKVLK